MRIDEQDVGVETMAVARIVRPVSAERVVRSGAGAPRCQQSVPDISAAGRQLIARRLGAARGVEDAELDARGMARKDGKIDAARGPGCPQRPRRSRLH